MTSELIALVFAILLGFVHLLIAANAATKVRGMDWNAGPRDEPKQPLTGMAGRLERAFRNYLETFAFFAAAVLIAHLANRHNVFTIYGAWIYLTARVIYLPLYAAGIPYLRSAVWSAGFFATLAINGLTGIPTEVVIGGGAGAIVVFIVVAMLQRFAAGVVLGGVLQVALIASGVLVGAMFVVGAVFAGLWVWCLVRARRIESLRRDAAEGVGG